MNSLEQKGQFCVVENRCRKIRNSNPILPHVKYLKAFSKVLNEAFQVEATGV